MIDTPLIHNLEVVEKRLLRELFRRRLDKLVLEVLRSGYGVEAEGLTYLPYHGDIYQLVVKLPETSVAVDDLGDGARHALVLAMIAALAHGTALLLEDPESHQHPGGLATILDALLSLAKENELQLFISTHSLELVRLLHVVSDEKGLEMAAFFLERDRTGKVEARRISPEDTGLLLKMGLDPRFLDII